MSHLNSKSAAFSRGNKGQFKTGQHWRQPKPHWDKTWLRTEYSTKQRSAADIAQEMGCTENNILFWLAKHKIKTRTMTEVRKIKKWGLRGADNPMFGKCGSANPHWIDGSSPLRQSMYARSFWKELAKTVYERDNYQCCRCHSMRSGKKRLHAHHMKPWAGNPDSRFELENIVTLCRLCHNWVHSLKNKRDEFLFS